MSVAHRELMQAAGKSRADKDGHVASAKMIQVVMKTGAPLPPPTTTAEQNTFDQNKFRAALDANDRATWTQMLADNNGTAARAGGAQTLTVGQIM